MILIGNQIIEKLQETLTFPKVTVKDFYSISKVTPPMVTLNEMPNSGVIYPDGMPKIVSNSFQIEVYCKAQKIEQKQVSAIEASKLLTQEVDNILNSFFGLTQVGEINFSPYVSDQTVMRAVARYRGYIDIRTEIIYR